jgi:chaperone modulatory protein CbpM
MTTYLAETIWLNEEGACSLEELADASGLTHEELHALIDNGVLEPLNREPSHYTFQLHYMVIARSARRLRDDFELDIQGLSVALSLLQRIQDLEKALENAQITLKS